MKRIFALAIIGIMSISLVANAFADTSSCQGFAYGYMSDGQVYMMLSGKRYGPFETMDQFKFTLQRMGPQFQANLKQYMLYEPSGSAQKYLVYKDQLGDCNPYSLDMETVVAWNAKLDVLFRKLAARFSGNTAGYRTVLANAVNKLNTKMNAS